MKKLIKTFLFVFLVLLAGFCVSCDKKCKEHDYVEGVCSKCEAVDPDYVSPLDQFKTAMAELETATSTINCDMVMTAGYKTGGQSTTMTQTMQLYIENSSSKAYTITTVEGEKTYTYAVQEGENVKSYAKFGDEWMLLETIAADEYSGMEDLLDVEVDDAFTLQNGVWVGNIEVLTTILSKVVEDSFAESGDMEGMTLDEVSIKKYDITLTEGKVSLVDIEMYMKMSYMDMVIEYTVEMPMYISKIGETTVTVPENLPVDGVVDL